MLANLLPRFDFIDSGYYLAPVGASDDGDAGQSHTSHDEPYGFISHPEWVGLPHLPLTTPFSPGAIPITEKRACLPAVLFRRLHCSAVQRIRRLPGRGELTLQARIGWRTHRRPGRNASDRTAPGAVRPGCLRASRGSIPSRRHRARLCAVRERVSEDQPGSAFVPAQFHTDDFTAPGEFHDSRRVVNEHLSVAPRGFRQEPLLRVWQLHAEKRNVAVRRPFSRRGHPPGTNAIIRQARSMRARHARASAPVAARSEACFARLGDAASPSFADSFRFVKLALGCGRLGRIEPAFQRVQAMIPEPAIRLEPGVEFDECLLPETVDALLSIGVDFHQTRSLQDAEMFGHLRLP